MTRDETVALFLECEEKRGEARTAALAEGKDEHSAREIAHEAARSHWNAWAESLLAEREANMASGAWVAEKDFLRGGLKAKNAKTRAWMERAAADFSRCLFRIRGAEETKKALGEVKDKAEAFEPTYKSITIDDDRIDMRGFVFPGNALFVGATFMGPALFSSKSPQPIAPFSRVDLLFHFSEDSWETDDRWGRSPRRASQWRTTFSDNASFEAAFFSGEASFESVEFKGPASFALAHFKDGASFENVGFSSFATFASATFPSSTDFSLAYFDRAIFVGVKVERAFTMTGAAFAKVPAFNQADFAQAPDLDDVRFPLPGFWRGGKKELVAQYRAIRRMAIQGADYEREQMAFKGEIRSKRWTEHRLYHAGLWFGLAYDFFSDFGRSLWRPALAWALLISLFAAYFLAQSGAIADRAAVADRGGWLATAKDYARAAWSGAPPPYCYPGTQPKPGDASGKRPDDVQTGLSGLVEEARGRTSPVKEAFSIAYHNALVVLDGNGDSAHRAFGCLYGVERYGGNPVAFVPRAVAIASGVQKLLSAAFIFLFGLALRNLLKVK